MSELKGPSATLFPHRAMPELTQAQFKWMSDRVRQLAGITLSPQKHLLVQSRIQRRLRTLGLPDFDAYLQYLGGPNGEEETVAFCNALTTNLTSFFRENHHFSHFVSELEDGTLVRDHCLKIWSAGCSTGQEPYSIAMTLRSWRGYGQLRDLVIDATDIDTNVLAKAERGHYSMDDLAAIPENMRRYFVRSHEGGFDVVPDVRKMIRFRNANLMKDWPRPGTYDVIFCRNVLIYFDAETKGQIIRRFAESLRAGGTLFLGHSETIMNLEVPLKMIGRTTYRRT